MCCYYNIFFNVKSVNSRGCFQTSLVWDLPSYDLRQANNEALRVKGALKYVLFYSLGLKHKKLMAVFLILLLQWVH